MQVDFALYDSCVYFLDCVGCIYYVRAYERSSLFKFHYIILSDYLHVMSFPGIIRQLLGFAFLFFSFYVFVCDAYLHSMTNYICIVIC